MKIFIPNIRWIGNFDRYINKAFSESGAEVETNRNNFNLNKYIHFLKLHQIDKIRTWELQYYLKQYNTKLYNDCVSYKPDVFLTFNSGRLYPHTIEAIKHHCKCIMVCIVADDPWDSIRFVTDFPHSLKYYDFIFSGDPIWSTNIRKVAPEAKIYWQYGGYDPGTYYPIDRDTIDDDDREKYTCELSFTGSSYGSKAEGAYRSDILGYLTNYDLKIWGDDNWPYRFKFLPQLKMKYKGSRLPYDDLRKLYTLSKINLNLPAPQVLTSFQPRVFEVAAVKGFQIADYRPLIRKLFTENELITFDSIGELREKIIYYLNNDKERSEITERLNKKVVENYTWKHWAQRILKLINSPDSCDGHS